MFRRRGHPHTLMEMTMRRSIPVVAAMVGLALTLTACSGSDDSGDDALGGTQRERRRSPAP